MTAETDLLPCPFCGGVPRVVRTTDVDDMKWAHVECYGCGARTRGDWASSSSDQCPIFFQEVRAAWNARACVSSATEALRAEASTAHSAVHYHIAEHAKTIARAERLAEALREAADMLLADYPETAKRLRAAVHPTAAQEDGK